MCKTWAENLLKDVSTFYENFKEFNQEYGFAVFYSPIRLNPELMIIGYNPGGDEKDFNKEEAMSIPEKHEYITYKDDKDYKAAKNMYELFKRLNKTQLLENSIKLNMIFFRTKNIAKWKEINKKIRIEIEEYCFNKVKEIIEKLKPRILLIEGIKTFDLFIDKIISERFHKSCKVECKKVNNKRILCKCSFDNIKVLGIIHPSHIIWEVENYLKMEL
ncbi:hypothetical protein FHQ18_09565 [Deferribacter autotrophicus]|uniref:Uracil-DNA glycosylase-like domain-containing protein n=1 Tax=Deferribacter autotrophicus TaxID=500465 RepID=A0A5A8F1I3_9BACT|nr:hypothetical protein [Deferribacter autotrophicus]KAA0257287.1 hypothetical protein FHQ18_09565 [Deferribacter autotrophicus]